MQVQIHKHGVGRIAARNPYNEAVKDACKSVIGSMWDPIERCWTFPEARLRDVVMLLQNVANPRITVEAIPPLVLPDRGLQPQQTGLRTASEAEPEHGFGQGWPEFVQPQSSSQPFQSLGTPPTSPVRGSQGRGSQQSSQRSGGGGGVFVVKIQRHSTGRICTRNAYNESVKNACKMFFGSAWDAVERCWTFPESALAELAVVLQSIPGLNVKVEAVPPIVLGEPQQQHWADPCGSPLSPTPSRLRPDTVSPGRTAIPSAPASASAPSLRQLQPQQQQQQQQQQSESGRGLPQVVVRIVPHSEGKIGINFPYVARLIPVIKSFPRAEWRNSEKLWLLPFECMPELEERLKAVQDMDVIVDPHQSLRAMQASTAGPSGDRNNAPPFQSHPPAGGASPSPSSPSRPWPSTTAVRSPPSSPQAQQQQQQQQQQPPPVLPKVVVRIIPYSEGKIAASFPFTQCLIPIMRSFPTSEWNATDRLWILPFSCMDELEEKLGAARDVEVLLQPLSPLVCRALEDIAAAPDDSDKYEAIPEALESKLMSFQREGVRFVLRRGGRGLIADEMGLGKTVQALSVCAAYKQEWPVLVLVPSSLLIDWAMAIHRWLDVSPSDISVVLSQSGGRNREGFNLVQSSGKRRLVDEGRIGGQFVIVAYSLVDKLMEKGQVASGDFRVAVVDESHYLKNPAAKRTHAARQLLESVEHLVLLTGTPALSRPIELFNQLAVLQPKVYHNVHEFGQRYCEGGRFGLYQGSSNREELHGLVKSTIMIRRLKSAVMTELPEKRRQQLFITVDDKGLKQLRALFDQRELIKQAIEATSLENEMANLRYKEQQLTTKIYTDSALVKIPAVQDYVGHLLDNDIKFLIFAHHETLMEGIKDVLEKRKEQYIRIDGKTPSTQRQSLVQRFQEKDDVRVALLSIRAAGVGLTLTAASTVVFAEMAWTPMDLIQAEDRAHRIGQASSVNVIYLHARETIDDVIWDVVGNKLESLGQVLDGREDRMHVTAGVGPVPVSGHTMARQTTLPFQPILRQQQQQQQQQPPGGGGGSPHG